MWRQILRSVPAHPLAYRPHNRSRFGQVRYGRLSYSRRPAVPAGSTPSRRCPGAQSPTHSRVCQVVPLDAALRLAGCPAPPARRWAIRPPPPEANSRSADFPPAYGQTRRGAVPC